MRPARILVAALVLLLVGATATGVWYYREQIATPQLGPTGKSSSAVETDSSLRAQIAVLSDSLETLDLLLREARIEDSEPPVALVRQQEALWTRYTWSRARLSERADSARLAATPGDSGPASPSAQDELGGMLGSLALYLWALVGLAVVVVLGLAWFFFLRRPAAPESVRPLTEPTLTRNDRNVRMPRLPEAESEAETTEPPREPTFSQLRRAQMGGGNDPTLVRPRPGLPPRPGAGAAPPPPAPEIPAAPPPRTGRHAWENTSTQPQAPAPSEPTVVQDYVVSMAKRGRTPAEIARRLRIPQDQVDLILKLRRNG